MSAPLRVAKNFVTHHRCVPRSFPSLRSGTSRVRPAGLWGRFTNNTTDALIPYVGLDYSDFSLGITYDVNVSSLQTASQSRGGIEISLIYIKKRSNGQHGIPCPRF